MTSHVVVRFTPHDEISIASPAPMGVQEARSWLDAEFTRLECVPLRASGKALITDKLLALADAVGREGFADAAWAGRYADAAIGALERRQVSIDVVALTVHY